MDHNTGYEALLAALLTTGEEAILWLSLAGVVEVWGGSAEQLYGYAAEEMIGQPVSRLLPVYELADWGRTLATDSKGQSQQIAQMERVRKNGALVSVVVKRTAIRNESGDVVGILERARNIRGAEGNTPAETQLRLLVEQMPAVLWTTDEQLRITSNWGSGPQVSRIQPSELVGRPVDDFLHGQDPQSAPIVQHYQALRGEPAHFEHKQCRRVLEIRIEPLRNAVGKIIGCIGVGVDVTERKKSEEKVRYQATHDELTGLANYRELMQTLEREVRRAERSGGRFSILLLDLNDLKRINDQFGHWTGNRALKRLAVAMKQQCRETDLAARYGGDEFGVVLIDSEVGMAQSVAGRIEKALRNDEGNPPLTVSMGIAVYPRDGRTTRELFEAADRELYGRKRQSKRTQASAG